MKIMSLQSRSRRNTWIRPYLKTNLSRYPEDESPFTPSHWLLCRIILIWTHLPMFFFGRSIAIQAVAIGTRVGATLLEAVEYLPSSPWDKNGPGRTVMPLQYQWMRRTITHLHFVKSLLPRDQGEDGEGRVQIACIRLKLLWVAEPLAHQST